MFYVMGQHRQAMISERIKKTLKSRKPNDCKPVDVGKIARDIDNEILKGKTIKLSSYYDSPAPALEAAQLARQDGAKKVTVEYFYFEGEGKARQGRKRQVFIKTNWLLSRNINSK